MCHVGALRQKRGDRHAGKFHVGAESAAGKCHYSAPPPPSLKFLASSSVAPPSMLVARLMRTPLPLSQSDPYPWRIKFDFVAAQKHPAIKKVLN